MHLKRSCTLFCFVALMLSACVTPVDKMSREIKSLGSAAGTTEAPRPRSGDLANCEVKSNENDSCLIDDKGGNSPARQNSEAQAMAIPFPSQCRKVPFPAFVDGIAERAAVEAAKLSLNAAHEACYAYMNRIEAIYGKDGDLPPRVNARHELADQTQNANALNYGNYLADQTAWNLVNQNESSQPRTAPSRASSASNTNCSNPFGGSAAGEGQFICSNEGELQACQCAGNSCGLVPTGSFLCTSPGAVIR